MTDYRKTMDLRVKAGVLQQKYARVGEKTVKWVDVKIVDPLELKPVIVIKEIETIVVERRWPLDMLEEVRLFLRRIFSFENIFLFGLIGFVIFLLTLALSQP